MENIIGIKFKNKLYNDVDDSSIKQAQVVGLYFSKSTSPPCKLFLKELLEFYKEVNLDGHKFEVLNIPFENNEQTLKDHIKILPWLTIPFGDNIRINNLKGIKFKIEALPSLIILNFEGTLVTTEGRKLITNLGEKAFEIFIKDLPQRKEEIIKEETEEINN